MKKIIPIILALDGGNVRVYDVSRGKNKSYARRSSNGF